MDERQRLPELMDRPDLDERRHEAALRGLARINLLSGSSRILWRPIFTLARRGTFQPLRVLDVASGAGDVAIRLWHRARKAGVPLHVEGCDISPRAVACAKRRADAAGADVRFFTLDILCDPMPTGYDVVMSSLFLHHLDDDQAVDLLREMARIGARLVLVQDLVRSIPGLVLAYAGTRLITASDVVHVDGPRSVRAAFTVAEVRRLANEAALAGAAVERRWPCRFLLTWGRS